VSVLAVAPAALGSTASNTPALATAPWGAWVTQVVDTTRNLAFFDSVATNSRDLPVIADSTIDGVHVDETTTGAAWTTVRFGADTLQPSVKVDARDHVHVCMLDQPPQGDERLLYATDASGAWVVTVVDADGREGFYCSLALDAQGRPHVAYQRAVTGDPNAYLKYAYQDAAGWHTEDVATVQDALVTISLALDPQGDPHVTFDDASTDVHNASVRYYSRAPNGAWTSETAVAHGGEGALAIGASGVPQVAYYAPGYQLGYATKVGGAWTTTIVDAASVTGQEPKIALDSHERPHIAYKQGAGAPVTDHPRYATRDANGSWVTEYVYLDSVVSLGPNIAVDRDDRPHVVFTQVSDQTGLVGDALDYATPLPAMADPRIATG
jgi:hypothetical protein